MKIFATMTPWHRRSPLPHEAAGGQREGSGVCSGLLKGGAQEQIARAVHAVAGGEALLGPAVAHRVAAFSAGTASTAPASPPELFLPVDQADDVSDDELRAFLRAALVE